MKKILHAIIAYFLQPVDYGNGDKIWYHNDKWHRTDGPALEWSNGYKAWWLNGERHRTNGPAIEYING